MVGYTVPYTAPIQDDPLLAEGAGEERVDLIYDQHAHFQLTGQGSDPMAQGGHARAV
jgi:hypothetical protein